MRTIIQSEAFSRNLGIFQKELYMSRQPSILNYHRAAYVSLVKQNISNLRS